MPADGAVPRCAGAWGVVGADTRMGDVVSPVHPHNRRAKTTSAAIVAGQTVPFLKGEPTVQNLLLILGRIGLSAIFILSGLQKISAYAGTQQYMESAGVPGALLPLVIVVELGGGLAILAGFFTRWVAIAMAVFSLVTAVLFHAHFDDAMQSINFWKNIGIAGGFLVLAAGSPGEWSVDHRMRRSR